MMYKMIVFICFSFFSANSLAGKTTANQIVNHLQFYKGHTGLLVRQPSMLRLEECSRADYYLLPKSHPYYSEVVSLIMAAHFSGSKLKFYIDGCTQSILSIIHVFSDK